MLFSIITPSFRQLDWLSLCAASIADQGIEVEHIVQDAGSPGIEAWSASHPHVKVVVEPDQGMYDAVNRGLRRATGKICAYLNCDEQYLPGALKKVFAFFEQHPEIDGLFGDAIVTGPDLLPLAYRRVTLPSRRHTLLRPLGVLTCSTFFRRKIVDQGVIFNPSWRIIGDKAWILSLLDREFPLAVLEEPLSLFGLTGENLSHHPDLAAEREQWRRSYGMATRLTEPWVLAHHLLKKWQRGAYRPQQLNSSWYTPDSLPDRRNFKESTLGWKWPTVK